jgi:hypothetical protein
LEFTVVENGPGIHVEFVGSRSTRTREQGEIQRGSLPPG